MKVSQEINWLDNLFKEDLQQMGKDSQKAKNSEIEDEVLKNTPGNRENLPSIKFRLTPVEMEHCLVVLTGI